MVKALFPGSFDPPTYGHINIIQRCCTLFTHLDVLIAENTSKNCLFTIEERLSMLKVLVAPFKNVSVHVCKGLVVDYAKKKSARVLIRGVRNHSDFSYEFDLSLLNRSLDNDIETLLMPTDPEFFVLKSSAIKELAMYGGDVSKMVPDIVQKELAQKGLQKNF